MLVRVTCAIILSSLISDSLAGSTFAGFGQVDQEHHAFTYSGQASFVTVGNRGAAQTFTIGRSGILSAVEVGLIRRVDNEAVILADIRRVVNNVPDFSDSGVLATRTMSSRALPIEVGSPGIYISRFTLAIDFRSDSLHVAVGDKLALHLHSNGDFNEPGTNYQFPWWWVDAPISEEFEYGGGDLYAPMSPTRVVPPLPPGIYPFHDDAHFRTYVLVPEPASVLLMLIGTAVLVGLRHRVPLLACPAV